MITILSEADLGAVALPDDAIRAAVEAGLDAQAEGSALAEPTVSFRPVPGRDDMVSVVRGALPGSMLAMVKTVGGFAGNAARNLPTNPGCLMLIETETGQTRATLPAGPITTRRTAMVSAIGAARLARRGASVVGCIGTAGIAVEAVRLMARTMALTEVRLHGRDPARTRAAAAALADEIGVPVVAADDWLSCLAGADVMIDGAALSADAPLLPVEAIGSGALLIVFGAYSSLPARLFDHVDTLVMDRWSDDGAGALGPHIRSGAVTAESVDALIGDIIAGRAEGRASPAERIVFCHRGVAACDLALASAYLEAAERLGVGTKVPF